ncbi:MAG: DegV family protein [Clostridia bacterium]|nr:DegV family protein [Clostridia bacterium]
MNYKIVMDSAGDIRELKGIEFADVPMKIIAGDTEFTDNKELDVDSMIDFLRTYKGKVSSACPSVGDFEEAFGDAENIFVITITSGLSGSYNAAMVVANTYPDRNIYVVDSLSAGPEMLLLAEKLRDLIDSGLEFDEITRQIEEYKKHTRLLFSLQSLHNFANNGRVSPAVAKLVGILGINLVGTASEQGTLEPKSKVRGDKKALPALIKNMTEMGYCGGKVRMANCRNTEICENIKRELTATYPNADILIYPTNGLCSFYAEEGGMLMGFEIK